MIEQIIEVLKKVIVFPRYYHLKNEITHAESPILFVGTSTYNNLGDHLLAYYSLMLLNDAFPTKNIIEVPTQIFKRFEKQLSELHLHSCTVMISAGGWMGNLWPEDEYMMQRMLNAFYKQTIYILPQTVYYDFSSPNAKSVLEDANNVYRKCNNLNLMVRERNSLGTAKKYLNIKNVYLFPDIGLYKRINVRDKPKIIMACIREDRESNHTICVTDIIKKYALTHGYEFRSFNTIVDYSVSIKSRGNELNSLFSELETARVVITDRLHGMIMAFNCGCKVVAIDNKTHKVSGVYNTWLKSSERVKLIEHLIDEDQICGAIEELANCPHSDAECISQLDKEFYELKKTLNTEYEGE